MENSYNIILKVKDLKTYFHLDAGTARAVDGVSFNIEEGKTLGIIGESGCGKSVTAQSILRIVPSPPGEIVAGSIKFKYKGEQIDLLDFDARGKEIRKIRGNEISMIFQEPMHSFGPLHTLGNQIMEAIMIHQDNVETAEARAMTVKLFQEVGIPRAEERVDAYPHEFSGGMLQRAMIAMALSCSPKILIADEPTTSIDVTIEAQILDLLQDLQEKNNMAIMLITHNLAVVSQLAHDIKVMYLGKSMEYASREAIFRNPLHPYTKGLWQSIPKLKGELKPLKPIKGVVPSPYDISAGCVFHPRCDQCIEGTCDQGQQPESVEVEPGHWVSCHLFS